MALTWIENKNRESVAYPELLQEHNRQLLDIKHQLTDILIKDGVEGRRNFEDWLNDTNPPLPFRKITRMNFSGQWEGADVQVEISAEGLKLGLEQKKDSSPVYVNIIMGDYETRYFLKSNLEESNVVTYKAEEPLEYQDSSLCLGLGQVVEAIQGGQLTKAAVKG